MFWHDLRQFADRVALVPAQGEPVTYAGLLERADALIEAGRTRLARPVERPLVLIETRNEIAPITAYVAALMAGWPVILCAAGSVGKDSRLRDRYRPNLVFREGPHGWDWEAADPSPAAAHPDLAVLLSTSGTTGAPKLVRLSRQNIEANARAIIAYLGIDAGERAITTLPFHYSYGMSVVNTHLALGATLVLTDGSVGETGFWQIARKHHATSLALVPFQFELLEKVGFAARPLPSLRYVTQAGGKLSDELTRKFLGIAGEQGWRLFVMYGQTEAGPRMAYVPPEALGANIGAIGRPVPGGRLWLRDFDGHEIRSPGLPGELIYEGPNVMLGYAERREDLAAPAGPALLATGDVAERTPNGFFRIVGRQSRFLKLFGLRVSLDEIERAVSERGLRAYATGTDAALTVFLSGAETSRLEETRDFLAGRYGLTRAVLRVVALPEVPMLPSGKVDYRRLAEMAVELPPARPASGAIDLEQALRDALQGREPDRDRSFAELGGDSLSYLEVQTALSARLGYVPDGWERQPLRELFALTPRRPSFWQPLPIDILGRVVSIFTIMAVHSTDAPTAGGSCLLIALVGYSLARFQRLRLQAGRVGQVLRTMLVPILTCYFIILLATELLGQRVPRRLFLLLGNFQHTFDFWFLEPYWFVSLYAQIMLICCLPFLLARVRAAVARAPFAIGVAGMLLLTAASRLFPPELAENSLATQIFYLMLVPMGWMVFFAATRRDKLLAAALILASVAVLWRAWRDEPSIAMLLLGGLLGLLGVGSVPVPAIVHRAMVFVAQRTMFIYLTHMIAILVLILTWAPAKRDVSLFLAVAASSILTGSIGKWAYDRAERTARGLLAPGGRAHLIRRLVEIRLPASRRRAVRGRGT